MSKSKNQLKTKADAETAKNLSMDELEQVSGGFSLRDVDKTTTTDIDDDTKSKI